MLPLTQRSKSTASYYPISCVHSEQTETATPVQALNTDLTGIPVASGGARFSFTKTPLLDLSLPSLSLSFTLTDSEPDAAYDILRPIPIVMEEDDECFVASFIEANLHASGESVVEALDNLKSYIGDVFEEFLQIGRERLGPGPSRELAILEQYIQERH